MKKYIFSLTICTGFLVAISHAQSWSVTGNSGTNPGINFFGTIDNKDVVFKTNNAERMRLMTSGNLGIGITAPQQKLDVNGNINIRKGFGLYIDNHKVLRIDSLNRNTFLGILAGASVTTGFQNTATGYQALFANANGSYNTAYGVGALASNTSGNTNVATGGFALFSNNGSSNTANGYAALYRNTSGANNVAIGSYALYSNTTGSHNIANGPYALYNNLSGIYNIAVGEFALYSNTEGGDNIASGRYALYSNTTGRDNIVCGLEALYDNKTGFENIAQGNSSLTRNTSGDNNVAIGHIALSENTTGYANIGIGRSALNGNSTGSHNTAVGYLTLSANSDSWNNTALGYMAGSAGGYFSYPNGWNNTFIGSEAYATVPYIYNSIAIGNSSRVTASDQARIGNSSTTSIGGYANWTNISDGRVKKNIKENVPGLTFINKLKPITYNLDLDAADKIIQSPARKDKDGKIIAPSQAEINARNAKAQIVYTGFVAQDVEKAAKELNYNFSGVDAAKDSKDLYGLRYSEFVVPLVKAVQELSKMCEEFRAKNDSLQQQINKLKTYVNKNNQSNTSSQAVFNPVLRDALLEQNVPNPFANTTAIHYNIPKKFTRAQIIITDNSGKTVKQVNLPAGRQSVSRAGEGVANIDASMLSAGSYRYSLVIDGKLISSKQMVLTNKNKQLQNHPDYYFNKLRHPDSVMYREWFWQNK